MPNTRRTESPRSVVLMQNSASTTNVSQERLQGPSHPRKLGQIHGIAGANLTKLPPSLRERLLVAEIGIEDPERTGTEATRACIQPQTESHTSTKDSKSPLQSHGSYGSWVRA